jgi:hypothetical protein
MSGAGGTDFRSGVVDNAIADDPAADCARALEETWIVDDPAAACARALEEAGIADDPAAACARALEEAWIAAGNGRLQVSQAPTVFRATAWCAGGASA